MAEVLQVKHASIVILNYNIMDYWVDLLVRYDWDLLILDEAHRVKHKETAVSKAVASLRDKCKACLCLSGTPLTDRNSDIWNVVRMVNKQLFPSHFAFQMRYCANEFSPGSNTSRSVNMLELHEKLVSSGTMIRRTKKDVYAELPKVTTEVVPLGVRSDALDALADEAKKESKWMKEQKGRERGIAAFRVQQSLEKYLQEAIRLKLPLIVDWIKDFLQESDEKLIVGVVHREKCGDILYNKFSDVAVHIDGSANAKKKDKLLTEFMTDDSKRLLVGNIQSVGTGIDGLQKVCSNMVIVEFPWSPADVQQLIARLDRNGQTEPVNVTFLVVKDSIDEMLIRMLDRKQKITGEVLDGVAPKLEDTLAYMLNVK
jgi:SNF2 family DNA or RNA helicase